MKTICYHHNDADGRLSAMIVKLKYEDVEFIEVNYGENDTWKRDDVKGKRIIVVDFSFGEDMAVLKELCEELIWIDHHKTAMEKNPSMWNSKSLYGIRNIEQSACWLSWKYFFGDNTIKDVMFPQSVIYVNDYDMWRFAQPNTKPFNETFNLKVGKDSVNDLELCRKVLMTDDLSREYVIIGKVLVEAKNKRVKKTFEDGWKFIRWSPSNKTLIVRVMNTNNDISDVGSFACNEKGYDVAVIWSVRKTEVVVSLRSKEVDVSEIAKLNGGGGHKLASGFTMEDSRDWNDMKWGNK